MFSPTYNNIHLVDNLLLPLMLLSQLYQLIPQGHIFPEKDQKTLWDLHLGWFQGITKNWRTKQFWVIYSISKQMASFSYSIMLGRHPAWLWMGRLLTSKCLQLICTLYLQKRYFLLGFDKYKIHHDFNLVLNYRLGK